jgi:two-component system chemotaxis response regulator CheV
MSFGINILKVSKITSDLNDVTRVPESHPAVKGVFRDMDNLVPLVDLAQYLEIENDSTRREKVIITEFFGTITGFWVERIDWIHHFKWEDVIDAEQVFSAIDHPYILGIVKPTEDRMIQLLDYETMLLDLNPHLGSKNNIIRPEGDIFENKKVLLAEDSPAVRNMLTNEMNELGFDVIATTDGAQAWEAFQQNDVDLVICDVEMPQMDGLALTLRIRQSERSSTPVIVYSSIGDIGMKARAQFLKADAHITKLNLDRLIDTIKKLLKGEKVEFDASNDEIPTLESVETVPID